MKNPTRIATVFVGVEIGLAALFGVTGATGHLHGTAYASSCFDMLWHSIPCPPCEEDEPCWDPCTMGNHVGYDPALGRVVDCQVNA